MTSRKRKSPLLLAAAALSLVAACAEGEGQAPEQAAMQAPQAPVVTAEAVTAEKASYQVTLPGRVTASRVSQVRPQVSGIVTERLFEEGEKVEAGAPLFRIEPVTYQAAFDSAQAQLARAEAAVAAAEGREERFSGLVERGGVSRQDYDDAVAAAKAARADVALARAARDQARIDLDRTTVSAPIAGHIGRTLVTEGALVSAGQAEPLAVVTALDPVYVDITQSSAALLDWKRRIAAGALAAEENGRLPVSLQLEDGTTYEHQGELALTEVNVDAGSGSVTLRAVFPNPQEILLPGMFVRAVIEEGVDEDAILVPQAALSRTPEGEGQVIVVDETGQTRPQTVATQRAVGNEWVVTGLEPGTMIVTSGFQHFRPGDTVSVRGPQSQRAQGRVASAALF
ncbi:efflux RND transporter periplasmic adaptor subunit [Parvularcula oceani]|uniref:efflux RND transporter periplasmic adaptor subunit n=1 Tax=Parvularcula oceani TaxID=1247963 RepID=UPI000566930C|nr:efflux RND transporter periplasmic adaptor subunit [Parvularcula oceani]